MDSSLDGDRLAEKGLFLVGIDTPAFRRSLSVLNSSPRILLLFGAEFHLFDFSQDLVKEFNRRCLSDPDAPGKGFYLDLPSEGTSGPQEILRQLAAGFDYFGEALPVALRRDTNWESFRRRFFDFHRRYFTGSLYLIDLLPIEGFLASTGSPVEGESVTDALIGWLDFLDFAVDLYAGLSRVRFLWHDGKAAAEWNRIATCLNADLPMPGEPPGESRLPDAFLAVRHHVEELKELQDAMVQLEVEDAADAAPGTRPDRLRRFREGIRDARDRILRFRQAARLSTGLSSGERLTGGYIDLPHWAEHVSRYRVASSLVRGKRVLDVACGIGYGCRLLAEAGARQVVGVDVSQDSVKYAHRHFGDSHVSFAAMSAVMPAFPDASFDVVVMLEVLEHLARPQLALSELERLLSPDGVLVISTPNRVEHPGQVFNLFHIREFSGDEFHGALLSHFPTVDRYRFGFSLATYLSPVGGGADRKTRIDDFLRDKTTEPEPPFFLAICRKTSKAGGPILTERYFPFAHDRLEVFGYLSRSREALAKWFIGCVLADRTSADAYCELMTPADLCDIRRVLGRAVSTGHAASGRVVVEFLLAHFPEDPELHLLYAECLRVSGDLERAEIHLKQAEVLGAGPGDLNRGLGLVRADQGGIEEARARLEDALNHCSSTVEQAEVGGSAQEIEREYLRRIIYRERHYRDALLRLRGLQGAVLPDGERSYLTALCLQGLEPTAQDARQHFQDALESGFDPFWCHYGCAEVSQRRGEIDPARKHVLQAGGHAGTTAQRSALMHLLVRLRLSSRPQSQNVSPADVQSSSTRILFVAPGIWGVPIPQGTHLSRLVRTALDFKVQSTVASGSDSFDEAHCFLALEPWRFPKTGGPPDGAESVTYLTRASLLLAETLRQAVQGDRLGIDDVLVFDSADLVVLLALQRLYPLFHDAVPRTILWIDRPLADQSEYFGGSPAEYQLLSRQALSQLVELPEIQGSLRLFAPARPLADELSLQLGHKCQSAPLPAAVDITRRASPGVESVVRVLLMAVSGCPGNNADWSRFAERMLGCFSAGSVEFLIRVEESYAIPLTQPAETGDFFQIRTGPLSAEDLGLLPGTDLLVLLSPAPGRSLTDSCLLADAHARGIPVLRPRMSGESGDCHEERCPVFDGDSVESLAGAVEAAVRSLPELTAGAAAKALSYREFNNAHRLLRFVLGSDLANRLEVRELTRRE